MLINVFLDYYYIVDEIEEKEQYKLDYYLRLLYYGLK